jgi:hypothetical protein
MGYDLDHMLNELTRFNLNLFKILLFQYFFYKENIKSMLFYFSFK